MSTSSRLSFFRNRYSRVGNDLLIRRTITFFFFVFSLIVVVGKMRRRVDSIVVVHRRRSFFCIHHKMELELVEKSKRLPSSFCYWRVVGLPRLHGVGDVRTVLLLLPRVYRGITVRQDLVRMLRGLRFYQIAM